MYTGRDLRLLRLIKGIPQKTIANKLGTSQQAVSKKEYSEKVSDENFEEYLNAANSSKEEFEKIKKVLPPPPDK
jgi:transcriptional regulator with XRE-family HTH domain